MLSGKLYSVNSIQELPGEPGSSPAQRYLINLTLNREHDIFSGHFPGNPILPGVCQVEIVRELTGVILGRELLLSQASQVKYLNLVNPVSNPDLNVTLKLSDSGDEGIEVSAEINSSTVVFMKMRGRFTDFKSE